MWRTNGKALPSFRWLSSASQLFALGSPLGSFLAFYSTMGEADVTLSQTDEKPPDPGLAPDEDSVVWSHEVEVCLFHAMIGHKPVGEQLLTALATER